MAAGRCWLRRRIRLFKIRAQAGGRLGGGLSGCLKAAEETPSAPEQIVTSLQEAGLPPGVVNLPFGDTAPTIGELILCAVYLHIASGRTYDARGAARVLKALLLTVAVAAIFLSYRFAVFAITLSTT